ncbi:MAG: 1-deoxy-D-xylulose-5-phosphate synthase [Clostridia bacterium]|nr:1-deoxy-D-xylulose-5-phosphate synthase [Clostridia bacterium]
MSVLSSVNCSDDILKLNTKELESLAEDLREEIVSVVNTNGGHLASNLGIVETTIALYRSFDFKKDRLIFDVGHQCYPHKILSDRKQTFHTVRTDGGVSGFPDRSESVYDAFTAGHAGTSISAALGYCAARDRIGEDYYVVAVVGDGSLSNGLNLEALSAKTYKPKKLIVILNDNGMSISKNDNGFYRFLSKHTARKGYVKGKRRIKKIFGNSFITKGLVKFRDFIKRVIGRNNYFENYGFKYVGVVDGNNIKKLTKILDNVKEASKEKAIFLHVKTTKGKGHEQAEEHADVFHGVGAKFSHDDGDFAIALGEKLNELIDNDKKIVAITAAMKSGTGLSAVEDKHPDNFYDVGIAEEFAVTFAAGMAAGGLKPFVCIYSTFLQRSYDQIIHDVCLQNLPVVFCLDRAGLVGSDGKTHQGVFDLSYLSHIPNLTVLAPSSPSELKDMLDYAVKLNSPVAIRYPKSSKGERKSLSMQDGAWERIKNGDKATILAVGPRMLELALNISEKRQGVGVINARTVKPLCEKTLVEIANATVITLEENSVISGFGSLVSSFYSDKSMNVKVIRLGVKDEFVSHGSLEEQMKQNGLTLENIETFLLD